MAACYLRLAGVAGQANANGYGDWIEVLSFTFGETKVRGRGRGYMGALSFVAAMSPSMSKLAACVVSGRLIVDGALEGPGFRITFRDLIATHCQRQMNGNYSASIDFAEKRLHYGAVPPSHTTIQPSHQYLLRPGG